MPLSGAQVTQHSPYGGPAAPYGDFVGKDAGLPVKDYLKTFTRQGIAGFSAKPYGTFSKSGAVDFPLAQTNVVSLSGALGLTGDLVYLFPEFELGASAALPAMSGVLGLSGDLGYGIGLAQTNTLALAGTLGLTGDLVFLEDPALEQTNVVALSGSLGLSGDLAYGWGLVQTNTLAMSGSMGLTGDIVYNATIISTMPPYITVYMWRRDA